MKGTVRWVEDTTMEGITEAVSKNKVAKIDVDAINKQAKEILD